MNYVVEVSCVVLELIISYIFFRSLFNLRSRPKYVTVASYAVFAVLISVMSILECQSVVRLLVSMVGFAVIAFLLFETKVISATASSLVFMTIYALTDVIVAVAFSWFGIDVGSLLEQSDARMVYVIISHIIFLGIIVVISLRSKSKQGIISWQSFLIFLPCWVSSLILCCVLCIQSYSEVIELNAAYIAVLLGLLYTNILVVYFVNRIREQSEMEHQANLSEQHYMLEREYYQELHAHQEQVRSLWHDISKYMKSMQVLADGEHSEEIRDNYLKIQESVNDIGSVVDVGNHVVSVILNEYMHIADESGIDFELDVNISPELSIMTSDLYIILGNTLDNSVNACCELEESSRKISLKLRKHNNILAYSIENPYPENYLQRARIGLHGYGLANVRHCAQKYDGIVETSAQNGIFTVNITLNDE